MKDLNNTEISVVSGGVCSCDVYRTLGHWVGEFFSEPSDGIVVIRGGLIVRP